MLISLGTSVAGPCQIAWLEQAGSVFDAGPYSVLLMQKAPRWGGGTKPTTAGMVMYPEIAKTSLLD